MGDLVVREWRLVGDMTEEIIDYIPSSPEEDCVGDGIPKVSKQPSVVFAVLSCRHGDLPQVISALACVAVCGNKR